jgi:predicted enzyme related to lactoylglutathione lyase
MAKKPTESTHPNAEAHRRWGKARAHGAAAGWAPSEGTTVVLDTPDCDAACAALRARGMRCDDPVVFPGFVTYYSFYDPLGNCLQMCGPAPGARCRRTTHRAVKASV